MYQGYTSKDYYSGSSSGQRPTSAGATRTRSSSSSSTPNVYLQQQQQQQHQQHLHHHANSSSNGASSSSTGYGRNNAGMGNIYLNTGGAPVGNTPPILSAGLLGAVFPSQQTQSSGSQRPSSAGHTRASSSSSSSSSSSHNPSSMSGQMNGNIYQQHLQKQQQQQQQQQQHLPQAALPQQPTSHPGHSIGSRPKSAGAIRRVDHSSNNGTTIPNIIGNNNPPQPQYFFSQQQQQQHHHHHQQQQQSRSSQQLPPSSSSGPHYSSLNAALGSQPTAPTRPSSASATSASSSSHAHSAGGVSDHWSTSYKLHYGYAGTLHNNTTTAGASSSSSSSGNAAASNVGTAGVPSTQQDNNNNNSNSNSIKSSKLRTAIDQSHKYSAEDSSSHANISKLKLDNPTTTGDANPGELDSDMNGERRLLERDDDDEMDGKPINDSRSHPEVSTTTPSHSVELGNGSTIDVRNSSMDDLPEEMINIGISTVPNQFCTVREAIELKKLLLLNKNNRGGIVPSSTAVMDMYMVGKVVGVGSYGKVRAAWHRLTGSKVAIKTYDKSKLKDPAHWKRVHSEIKIMEQVSHPRIARMYEAVETPKRMHLIMECLDGGNLCSYVKAKKRLSEEESRRIFFQILQAIEHLHMQGVSHRDVKLENVLFADSKDVKLIDFGFSTICQAGKRLKVFCGTPSYMAPEIVRRTEYEGRPVDIWSMGILLYALLCGCFPFRAKSYPDLYRKIARGTFSIPEELSMPVRDLLRQLLTVDVDQRITAYAALRHPWLQVQLATSPDIDRLRLETPILISDRPADDLDDQVLDEMEKFGMQKEELVRFVLTKTHSSICTLYYLLLDVCINRRHMMGGGSKRASSTSYKKYGSSSQPLSAHYMQHQQQQQGTQPMTLQQQQQQQQQMLLLQQQQQQQMLLNRNGGQRQDFSLRPRSASAQRASSGTSQRPLSAYAGRR